MAEERDRRPRSKEHGIGSRTGAKGGGKRAEVATGDASKACPERLRPGEAEVADLVEGLDLGRAAAALRDEKGTDRLDIAVLRLSVPLGATRQRGTRRLDGVGGIGLAGASPALAVRPVNLHDLDAGLAQEACEARAVRARALDADPHDLAVALEEAQQRTVACRCRGELANREQPADRIEGCGDVRVEVGVHPTGDTARLLYCPTPREEAWERSASESFPGGLAYHSRRSACTTSGA